MTKREWSEPELLAKAERYCAIAEHCISEVNEKLYQWGATSSVRETIIDRLVDLGFINEERYCRAFAHDKLLFQGWGRVKIRAALQAKRLPSAYIVAGLEQLNEEDYQRILQHLIETKKGLPAQQVARFLLQRGFEWSEFSELIELPS